jgi:SAM-dependent methyltransferase
MPYFLPEGYAERLGAPQSYDAGAEDDGVIWQAEIYETAHTMARVLGLRTVLDVGCGSGRKLVDYFGGQEYYTVGVDLAPAVERLRNKYPDHLWCTASELIIADRERPDLLICADVLEHLDDPDALLEMFKHIRPRWMVISTPDRKLMEKYPKWGRALGPPANYCHVREWAFKEFRMYMDTHFTVSRHWISNREQCTQAVIAHLRD